MMPSFQNLFSSFADKIKVISPTFKHFHNALNTNKAVDIKQVTFKI